jgi:C1A family cysteine protease
MTSEDNDQKKLMKFIPIEKLLKAKIDMSLRKRVSLTLATIRFGMNMVQHDASNPLPDRFDLKSEIAQVYNQLSLNSCVANAVATAYQVRQKNKDFLPSRLQLYFNSRKREDPNVSLNDSGTHSDAALRHVEEHGICAEELWPYIEANVDKDPPAECDQNAALHKLSGIFELNDSDPVKQIEKLEQTLYYHRLVILLGISVYKSTFGEETKRTGIITMPKCAQNYYDPCDANDPFLGGHEMCIVGYDRPKRLFICLNSFGTEWGDNGFCYLPFDYITNKYLTLDLCSFYNVHEPMQESGETLTSEHDCEKNGCVCKYCSSKFEK